MTVSAFVPPQVESCTLWLTSAVQRNHTSWCATGQLPVCCGLSVEPPVLTPKVPVPEIGAALAQLSEPCAAAGRQKEASARETAVQRWIRRMDLLWNGGG